MRRSMLTLAALVTAVTAVTACGAPGGDGPTTEPSTVPDKPSKAVNLNVLDVAGDLALTQPMIDDFVAKNPGVISKVTYQKATAPELTGKIKAQQNANRVDIDLVLTGVDGLSAGVEQGIWTDLLPKFQSRLSGMSNYLEPAANMQNLLTYAKAHKGKVQYARPANSGPGRTFLMGLPYLLGDSDPKDPVNGWDKTWAYLKELNQYVDYYPSGTSDTMKNLANGSADIVASTTGWDINPRVLGTVPKEAATTSMKGFHWISDAHYAVVPKGVSADQQSAVLLLLNWMLKPDQQAKAYDDGYFYPGPAVKGVTLDQAPAKSQQAIKEYGRPEYDALIADNPVEVPLDAKSLVAAFDRWDREVGGAKVKK
jgi:putative spermidine/putrescine transport system substrate-binding protein